MTPGAGRGSATVTVFLDGVPAAARAGESVAALLVRLRRPLTLFCGMGACHTCALTLDGISGRRACIEQVQDGMQIELAPEGD